MKKAIRIIALTVSAECPCGGSVLTAEGSYSIYTDSGELVCDTCGAKIRLGKHVRLFG